MELKGTKTEVNLQDAFAGESQARNKYNYYGSQAKKDGYVQIMNFFNETSDNEKEHAKLWFKLLHGGKVPTTTDNLKDAASGELFEWTKMYKAYAETAREEGFNDIADLFDGVALIEKRHEERYLDLLKNIEENKVFVKEEETAWICTNCGHIHYGTEAPEVCPVCNHPQAHFEVFKKNY